MSLGDILFIRGRLTSLIDDGIKLVEHIETHMEFVKCYTHCCIYIGNGEVAEAQGGRQSGSAPLPIYEGNYDVGHVDLTDEQRKAVVYEAKRQYGKPYDYILDGVIALKEICDVDVGYHESNGRICSTYINDVFKEAVGITLPGKEYPTPEDLALSHHITLQHIPS